MANCKIVAVDSPVYDKLLLKHNNNKKAALDEYVSSKASVVNAKVSDEQLSLFAKPAFKPTGKEKHFPNNAKSGVKERWQSTAGYFKPELLSKGIGSTHDAILQGYRTGTSRNSTQRVKIGDIINVGKYGTPIYVTVTKVYNKPLGELLKSNEMTKAQWSDREGWRADYIDSNPAVLNKYPLDFELVHKPTSIVDEIITPTNLSNDITDLDSTILDHNSNVAEGFSVAEELYPKCY